MVPLGAAGDRPSAASMARTIATPRAAEQPSPAAAGRSVIASTESGDVAPHASSSARNARARSDASSVVTRRVLSPALVERTSSDGPSLRAPGGRPARAVAPRSIPMTIAGTPYTTACSPSRMTFPKAEPVIEFASNAWSSARSGSPLGQRRRRAQEPRRATLRQSGAREGADRLLGELLETSFDGQTRAALFVERDDRSDLRVGGVASAERFGHRVAIGGSDAGQGFVEQRGLLPRPDVAAEGLPGFFRQAKRTEDVVAQLKGDPERLRKAPETRKNIGACARQGGSEQHGASHSV